MTATVFVSLAGLAWQLSMGIALGIALGVLIAHLCAPKVKKFVAVGLLAVMFALAIDARTRASEDGDFLIQNPCRKYTPADPPYWYLGCWLP